mgnify:CR=1 FL=1
MNKQPTALEIIQMQMRGMEDDIEELRGSQTHTESASDILTHNREEDKLSMNTSVERHTVTEFESIAPSISES